MALCCCAVVSSNFRTIDALFVIVTFIQQKDDWRFDLGRWSAGPSMYIGLSVGPYVRPSGGLFVQESMFNDYLVF